MHVFSNYPDWLGRGRHRRWLIVVASVLINTALGVRHAWSVFGSPLAATFHWDPLTTTAPLIVSTIAFAVLMIPAGGWTDRFGPLPVGLAGGILMGLGFMLAGLAPQGPQDAALAWVWVMLTYGVMTGAATALAYAVAVATCIQWFPDRRGLVTGLCVFGFGFSTVLFAPLANTMILQSSVWNTFFELGIVFALMIIAGSVLLTRPPNGWRPPHAQSTIGAASAELGRSRSPQEILRMRETFLLILMFACSTASGLMVISFAKEFLDSIQFNHVALSQGLGWIGAIPLIGFNVFSGRAAELSAAAVGWLGLWNALGRLFVGWVSDRIGRRLAMLANFALTALAMLLTPWFTGNAWTMLAMCLLIGLTFGGTLTIFPAITADWFGTRHAGANYGIIFLGWGLGGVIRPVVGDLGLQALGSYQGGFMFAAALGVLATLLAIAVQAPAGLARAVMQGQAAAAAE